MIHVLFILFIFVLGACIGSFLNVVVWRLPRGQSLVRPGSHCPRCSTPLAWYDNIPVFGWIALRGKCRYCRQPISPRYPIVEALTGGLFVFYYVAFFIYQQGPCWIEPADLRLNWPIYGLDMLMLAALLAASLIDAELFIIPIEIPWIVAIVALLVHAITDMPRLPGALNVSAPLAAMAAGAGAGLILSLLLLRFRVLPQSFADGAPLLEIEKKALAQKPRGADACADSPAPDDQSPAPREFSSAEIRQEMRKEMLFLMPPLILGGLWLLLCWKVPFISGLWRQCVSYDWVSGLLGSLWGALVGAFVVWFFRIAGSVGFGREAMGLGDAHLMLGVGAVIGAYGAVLVFFIAPFFGLLYALYRLIFHRTREVPYGPFLSMATAIVVLFYCRIVEYLSPSMQGLMMALQQVMGS